MARLEVELLRNVPLRAIPRELAERMPGRGLESIRKARNRQPYRDALVEAEAEIREMPAPTTGPRGVCPQQISEARTAISLAVGRGIRAVIALEQPQHKPLLDAAREVQLGGNPHALLVEWYRGLCPPPQEVVRAGGVLPERRGPEARRDRYRRYQGLWTKDRPGLAADIMGTSRGRRVHSAGQLSNYWGNQWAIPSAPWNPDTVVRAPVDEDMSTVWTTITVDDVRQSEPGRTACGPDGLTAATWKEVPRSLRALFFNVILLSGTMPAELLRARTTMLPKTERPRSEAEYRPITVASVAVRQLHRILAMRLERVVRHVKCQRGLRRGLDGIGANVVALEDILYDARVKRRELRLAIMDVEKAFDRVSHRAIMNIMAGRSWPAPIVQYIEAVYRDGTTAIGGGPSLMVARGIRQGDPLSSVLFNIIMDHVLLALPGRVGYNHGAVRVNSLAFADDVVLLASSEAGIRTLATSFAGALEEVGLNINLAKSMYIPLVNRGGRMVIPREGATLVVGDRELQAARAGASWVYLGVPFGTAGSMAVGFPEVRAALDKLAAAPLKPLQKLEMLRTHILPSFLHRLVLARTHRKVLEKIDIATRALVRRWLRLPHDSANAYIHGPVGDGGLGVMRTALLVPELKAQRVARARAEVFGAEAPGDGPTAAQRRVTAAARLHATTDGADLVGTRKSWASSQWLRRGDAFTSGRKGVAMVRVHSGSVPSRVRVSRGRRENLPVACRAGCAAMETAAHAIQVCPVTRTARCARHNYACRLLATYASIKRWQVWVEPHFQLADRGYRPDIVISNRSGTWILDVSICSGGPTRPVERVSRDKVEKYAGAQVAQAVAGLVGCEPEEVKVLAVTITWKGVWDPASVRGLRVIGYPRFLMEWITVGVLVGSSFVWSVFLAENRRRRRGRPPR